MADVPFSDFGSKSIFRLVSKASGTIASGVTGDILNITAPAGQVARLTFLLCSGASTQSGISVIRDGVTCLSGVLSENDASPSGDFLIAETYTGQASSVVPGLFGRLITKEVAGEQIKVNKNAGLTTQAIIYAVEYGVMS